jgi:hypothetical protein
MKIDRVVAITVLISSVFAAQAATVGSVDDDAPGVDSVAVRKVNSEGRPKRREARDVSSPAPHRAPNNPQGHLNRAEAGGDQGASPIAPQIVAYTWEPVPEAADRLVYAIRVDRRNYDVHQVAAQLEAMPPGHRAIRLWKWAHPDLTRHPDDVCRGSGEGATGLWYPRPEAGLLVVRSRWEEFLDQLSDTGAPLDEVILDFEAGYGTWGMNDGQPAAIMADPRWQGITSYEAGELTDISNILDYGRSSDHLLWNAVADRIVDGALQEAIYEPLQERYPHRRCSNYGSFRVLRRYVVPSIAGAHPQWYESDGFGTHEGPVAYGTISTATAGHIMRNGEPLGTSPYAAFLYTIKRIEGVEASTARPLKVWVCNRNKPTPRRRPVRGTPYNDEILRHMLVRRHGLVLWNANMGSDVREMMQTNAVIEDVAARIGETGSALPSVTGWQNTVVHSSTTGPGRVVHRFTLEFPNRPLRYRINDVEHVRFPDEGEVGIWVTHAPDDVFGLLTRERRFVVQGLSD